MDAAWPLPARATANSESRDMERCREGCLCSGGRPPLLGPTGRPAKEGNDALLNGLDRGDGSVPDRLLTNSPLQTQK